MDNADLPAKSILKASKEQGDVVSHEYEGGLSKREKFAMAAMQGLLSHPNNITEIERTAEDNDVSKSKALSSLSIECADALLTELNQ